MLTIPVIQIGLWIISQLEQSRDATLIIKSTPKLFLAIAVATLCNINITFLF